LIAHEWHGKMIVEQREIVEMAYQLPGGEIKSHPALVVSSRHLLGEEDLFYAVLICTKNLHPEYALKVEDCCPITRPFHNTTSILLR
jgi:hypothetical protein